MTGISTTAIDCTSSSPMPGHWNTVSVTIEKASSPPKFSPMMVITGTMRVAQRVAEIDRALAEPARTGELDVVRPQHLQHLGAHEPHDQRHREKPERHRGQDRAI